MAFDLAQYAPHIAAVVGGAVTAYATVYVAKAKTKTDINQIVNAGFQTLTGQLLQERKETQEIIEQMQETIASRGRSIEQLFSESEKFRGEARIMQRRIDDLERLLRSAGIAVPPFLP